MKVINVQFVLKPFDFYHSFNFESHSFAETHHRSTKYLWRPYKPIQQMVKVIDELGCCYRAVLCSATWIIWAFSLGRDWHLRVQSVIFLPVCGLMEKTEDVMEEKEVRAADVRVLCGSLLLTNSVSLNVTSNTDVFSGFGFMTLLTFCTNICSDSVVFL